jgi:DNA processing protein
LREDIKYWIGFNNIPGIGRVRLSQLENYFGSLANAWKAPVGDIKKSGIENVAVRSIEKYRPEISLDDILEKVIQYGIKVITYKDTEYPSRLKEIYDFPPVLYLRGNLLPEDEWCLAVVGTRRTTMYGKQVTEEIVSELARHKITIVSGLAKGVDTAAHRAALKAGGRTLAVFACGLDIVYPSENARLARDIMDQGCLISEYALGTKPRGENFPRRNRILSGLSLGVLVSEASESSGAMITARMALEQNREVLAIPGSILSPVSRGTNRLIQEGAKLVRDYEDVLEELNLTTVTRQIEMKEILPDTENEVILLRQLSAQPTHIDEVCRKSGLAAATVSGTLAMMELKGLVKQIGTMNYVLSREVRQEYKVRVD